MAQRGSQRRGRWCSQWGGSWCRRRPSCWGVFCICVCICIFICICICICFCKHLCPLSEGEFVTPCIQFRSDDFTFSAAWLLKRECVEREAAGCNCWERIPPQLRLFHGKEKLSQLRVFHSKEEEKLSQRIESVSLFHRSKLLGFQS